MLSLLLAGCYDAIVTDLTLDLKTGTAHVRQVVHNPWPDQVDCQSDVPTCVAGIRAELAESRADLEGVGGTMTRAGVRVVDGKLDLVYVYEAPLSEDIVEGAGIGLLDVHERSPAQLRKGREGRPRFALVTGNEAEPGTIVEVRGRAQVLDLTLDEEPVRAWLLRGRKARAHVEKYNVGDDGQRQTAGAWVAAMPGLTEAIAASGMVVE